MVIKLALMVITPHLSLEPFLFLPKVAEAGVLQERTGVSVWSP